MGLLLVKCSNCDNKGMFLKTANCKVCGKEGCEKCFMLLFAIGENKPGAEDSYYPAFWETWYACGKECATKFADETARFISYDDCEMDLRYPKFYNDTAVEDYDPPGLHNVVLKAIMSPDHRAWVSNDLLTKIEKAMKNQQKDTARGVVFRYLPENVIKQLSSQYRSMRTRDLWEKAAPEAFERNLFFWRMSRYLHYYKADIDKKEDLKRASDYEKARRFEDAAQIYEDYKMYEEAGRVRAKGEEILVKQTNFAVDLNRLLQQVREGGIVAIYKCPHCGGKLKIGKETSLQSVTVCEHCGSEIQAMDLVDFLKTVLS